LKKAEVERATPERVGRTVCQRRVIRVLLKGGFLSLCTGRGKKEEEEND